MTQEKKLVQGGVVFVRMNKNKVPLATGFEKNNHCDILFDVLF